MTNRLTPSYEERLDYYWIKFVDYAESEGISLNDIEDYGAWWECWKAGIDAHRERMEESINGQT